MHQKEGSADYFPEPENRAGRRWQLKFGGPGEEVGGLLSGGPKRSTPWGFAEKLLNFPAAGVPDFPAAGVPDFLFLVTF